MFERFTERARQVVVLAQEEARTLGHDYIGSEHILLGLLREQEGVAARVLASLGVTAARVREQVVQIVGRGEQVPTGQIPFTPRGKKILELALREALGLGHNYIGPEHILLGLVRENEGVAARVLLDFDADAEKVRNKVVRVLSGPDYVAPKEAAAMARPRASVIRQPRADAPVGPSAGPGLGFQVTPDPELRRVLMAAAGRALQDGRERFGLADLRAVIEPDSPPPD